ncbi:hypothetical protein THAOC_32198, partial [Thalassiosira oceanica]
MTRCEFAPSEPIRSRFLQASLDVPVTSFPPLYEALCVLAH